MGGVQGGLSHGSADLLRALLLVSLLGVGAV